MKRLTPIVVLVAALTLGVPPTARSADGPTVVTLDSPSPLLQIRLMVRVGSAHDPAGKEGLARLTAQALLQGGYGDPDDPVTKEMLAERTLPWGAGARPDVLVDKQATTFSFTVPRDALDEYVEMIFRPLLARPLFAAEEISRLVEEAETSLNQLRFENLEMVGLEALDVYLHEGTGYGHPVGGTEEGLANLARDDVLRFYRTHYRPDNLILGVSSADASVTELLRDALAAVGGAPVSADVNPLPEVAIEAPAAVAGRELTVVGLPNAGAAGIHLGFPLPITRADVDWWPLYVANVHFGTHRDSHSYLYQRIREERGYNYGDYSYIEHFPFRPFFLFQPWNAPRQHQYFSIWIRPVGTEYAHHLLKASVFELRELVENGLTAGEVERSKNKARVLYLNLAENTSRLLEAKVDDAFYGMSPGHLEGYLDRIDAVTTERVNEAIRRYLQTDDLKMLIVTEASEVESLVADIEADRNGAGKTPEEYRIPSVMEGEERIYQPTPEQQAILDRDAMWEALDLRLDPEDIRWFRVEDLFVTGEGLAGQD